MLIVGQMLTNLTRGEVSASPLFSRLQGLKTMRGRKGGGQGHQQLRLNIKQAEKEGKRLSVFLKEKEAIIKKGK